MRILSIIFLLAEIFLAYALNQNERSNLASNFTFDSYRDVFHVSKSHHAFDFEFLVKGDSPYHYSDITTMWINGDSKETDFGVSLCKPNDNGQRVIIVKEIGESIKPTIELLLQLILANQNNGCSAPYVFLDARNDPPPAVEMFLDHCMQFIANKYGEIPINSDVYILKKFNNSTQLIELYSLKQKLFTNAVHLQNNKVNIQDLIATKLKRRQDFHGLKLTVTAVNGMSYSDDGRYTKMPNGSIVLVGGRALKILGILQDCLNFRGETIFGYWHGFGENRDEYRPDTIGNQIEDGLADLVISQSILTLGRAKRFSYLQPIYLIWPEAFFIQPNKQFKDIYLSRFDQSLWVTLILTYILIILSIKLSLWIKTRFQCHTTQKDQEIAQNGILWAIGAMAQQGWYISPVSLGIKIMFITGSFIGLLTFTGFSASIVSILSVKFVAIKNRQDLFRSPLEPLLDRNLHSFYNLTKLSGDTKFSSSSKYLIESDSAFKILNNGQNYLISWAEKFYGVGNFMNFCGDDLCAKYSRVSMQITPVSNALFVKKGSPLKEFFNHKIIRMKEIGVNFRILRKLHYFGVGTISEYAVRPKQDMLQALGIDDVYLAYFVLLSGYVFSTLIFIIEKFTFRLYLEKLGNNE